MLHLSENVIIKIWWIRLPSFLRPAAILDVPRLYSSVKGGRGQMSIPQKRTAGDAVAAAHQGLHFLFATRREDVYETGHTNNGWCVKAVRDFDSQIQTTRSVYEATRWRTWRQVEFKVRSYLSGLRVNDVQCSPPSANHHQTSIWAQNHTGGFRGKGRHHLTALNTWETSLYVDADTKLTELKREKTRSHLNGHYHK